MIEDQAGILTRRTAKPGTDTLNPPGFLFSGSGIDYVARIAVEIGHQHTHGYEDFCRASFEAVDHYLPLVVGSFRCHDFCVYPALLNWIVTRLA